DRCGAVQLLRLWRYQRLAGVPPVRRLMAELPCWVDGRPADGVPVTDRGLAYGDGLFETIAVRAGRATLLARHLARLASGCERLGMPLEQASMRSEIEAFC